MGKRVKDTQISKIKINENNSGKETEQNDLGIKQAGNQAVLSQPTKIATIHVFGKDATVGKNSIEELIQGEKWVKLNDRFYKHILWNRQNEGKNHGKNITAQEQGERSPKTPRHAAIGTNTLSEITMLKASKPYFSTPKNMFFSGYFRATTFGGST